MSSQVNFEPVRPIADDVVILGAGHAAHALVSALTKSTSPPRITLVGAERDVPYNRPPLSKKYLLGEVSDDDLILRSAEQYAKLGISTVLEDAATAIDPSSKEVRLRSGRLLGYSNLVIATGSRARSLPASLDQSNGRVFSLRSLADALTLREKVRASKGIVILGGGYIGLEVAASCVALGKSVTVVEAAPRLLARVAEPALSNMILALHQSNGVSIHLGRMVVSIREAGSGCVTELDDGTVIPSDFVLSAIGSVPNSELARDAGLEVEDGIIVNERCVTSNPSIFAIGDCTSFVFDGRKMRLESIQNANDQANVVSAALGGGEARYNPVPWFWSDQYDARLQSVGIAQGADGSIPVEEGATFALWHHRDGRIIALDTINNPRQHMLARKRLAAGGIALSELEKTGYVL